MKKLLADICVIGFVILGIACLIIGIVMISKPAHAEETDPDYIVLTSTGSNVNCRMAADKHSFVVTELEKGQEILSTGRWSKDHKWVEVFHPEYGNLWVSYKFLTERTDSFMVETLCDDPVKIRKEAVNGRVVGKLRKGRTVEITQVVLGWGKCKQGWLDLSFCIETGD